MQRTKDQAFLMVALLLVIILWNSGMVLAQNNLGDNQVSTSAVPADSMFTYIAHAWNQGDEQALAGVVHPDGVRINTVGPGDRLTRYSPSQAYYFFKNLFQNRLTEGFSFVRVQQKDDQDRTHALAVWLWRVEGQELEKEDKFIFVLSLKQDRWLLSEINSIK